MASKEKQFLWDIFKKSYDEDAEILYVTDITWLNSNE